MSALLRLATHVRPRAHRGGSRAGHDPAYKDLSVIPVCGSAIRPRASQQTQQTQQAQQARRH